MFMPYVNNKDTDQPAHPHSLISAFVVHCRVSITTIVAIPEISRLWLTSVPEEAGLSLTWSHTLKTCCLVNWLRYLWAKEFLSASDSAVIYFTGEDILRNYAGINIFLIKVKTVQRNCKFMCS